MTEQPVETEEQFLGNEPTPARLEDAIVKTLVGEPLDDGQKAVLNKVMQHHVPNAHLLRRPSWSPVDDVELASLARKSAHANRLLAIAKAEAVRAEEALQLALGVEDKAAEKVREADEALIAFTRKGAGL